jgi:hypothetical protein
MSHKAPFTTSTDWGVARVDGTSITAANGIISINAVPPPSLNYGFFYDTTTQLSGGADVVNPVSWDSEPSFNQVILNPPTKLTVLNAGTYTKVFTVSLQKTDPGTAATVSIWLRYSPTIAGPSVDVVESRQDIVVPNQATLLFVTGGYTLAMATNSYVEMFWSSADPSIVLAAAPAAVGPVRPAIPSAKITLTRIS